MKLHLPLGLLSALLLTFAVGTQHATAVTYKGSTTLRSCAWASSWTTPGLHTVNLAWFDATLNRENGYSWALIFDVSGSGLFTLSGSPGSANASLTSGAGSGFEQNGFRYEIGLDGDEEEAARLSSNNAGSIWHPEAEWLGKSGKYVLVGSATGTTLYTYSAWTSGDTGLLTSTGAITGVQGLSWYAPAGSNVTLSDFTITTTFTTGTTGAGSCSRLNEYTWTSSNSRGAEIGSSDEDFYDGYGCPLSRGISPFMVDSVSTKYRYATQKGVHEYFNLQEELFSNLAREDNNIRRREIDVPEDQIPKLLTNGSFNRLRFVSAGTHYGAVTLDKDDFNKISVGSGSAVRTSQAMGHETLLGGLVVDEGATGYSFISGYDVSKDRKGNRWAEEVQRTLILGSSSTANEAEVNFDIYESFSLGTSSNPWEDIQMADGADQLKMMIYNGKTFTINGRTNNALNLKALDLSGGGTLTISHGISMDVENVTLLDGSTFNMNGGDNVTGTINMQYGSLRNASGFTGTVIVNADQNSKQDNAVFNVGGVLASQITIQGSAPRSLQNIGSNSSALDSTLKIDANTTFRATAANFTLTSSPSGTYMLHFSNPSNGYFQFTNRDARVSLDFDMSTIPGYTEDWVGSDGVVLPHFDKKYDGKLYFWFTNATLLNDDSVEFAADDYNGINEWFWRHFEVPAWVTDIKLNELPSMTLMPGKTGVFSLSVSTDGTWISSREGEVISYITLLDETMSISSGTINKWLSVYVDSKLTLNLTPDSDTVGNTTTLRYLSSGGDTEGGLTINNLGDEDLNIVLFNNTGETNKGGQAINANTTFSKNITVKPSKNGNDVHLRKVGAGTLTINGNLTGDAVLSVAGQVVGDAAEAGKLVLNGLNNEVKSIEALEGTDGTPGALEVNGVLTVKDATDLTAPAADVAGTLGGSGILVVKDSFAISSERMDEGNTLTVIGGGANALIAITGSQEVNLGALGGSGTLQLDDADLTIKGGLVSNFRGSIDAAAGNIRITAGSKQGLQSAGNENRNLIVENGATLTVIGEPPIAPRALTPAKKRAPMLSATYGDVTVGASDLQNDILAGRLNISAAAWSTASPIGTTMNVKNISFGSDSVTQFIYNFAGAANENLNNAGPMISATGSINIDRGANFVLNSLGSNFALSRGADIVNLPVMTAQGGITGDYATGENLQVTTDGIFLVYYKDAKLSVQDNTVVLNAGQRHENVFAPAALDSVSAAGADLLWAARYMGSASIQSFNPNSTMYRLMEHTATLAQRGGAARAAKILAGVAGSTIPALGTAQRDAFRAQMLRMRDHTGMIGLNPGYAYDDTVPFYHAWVEATGHFAELHPDGLISGYRLNSWGGSVGMDFDVDNTTTVGIGLSALYGDLTAGNADTANGNLDGYYLSFMGRFQTRRWAHTVVATVGLNQAKLDRRVDYETGSYTTNGSTNGWAAGIMYELTYAILLDEEGSSVIEPLANVSIMTNTLKGYKETGENELGLTAGKQKWTTASVGLGARYITEIGEQAFSRPVQLELRANVAQDFCDNRGESEVALHVNPTYARKVAAREVGKTGFQLGAGLRAPVDEENQVYLNTAADLRSGMATWNLSFGWRHDF